MLGFCLNQTAVELCALRIRSSAASCRKYYYPGSGVAWRHVGACLVLPRALCFVADCGVVLPSSSNAGTVGCDI